MGPTRRLLVGWGFAVWVVVATPAVVAQNPASCESLLTMAEERYIQLAFPEAESLVQACLAQPDLSDADAVRAYRQLALISLQQDVLSEAKQAVLQLLSVSFEYTPDPTRDPPGYVALVTSIKEQLQVEQTPAPADSAEVVPPVVQTEPAASPDDILIVQTDPESEEEPAPTVELRTGPERKGLTKWLLIGGGAVVAGAVAVLLTSGGSSTSPPPGDPFPPPPAFPR